MKKLIFTLFLTLLVTGLAYSQREYKTLDPERAGKIFRNPVYKKSKPQGSPYLQKMFTNAIVEDLNLKAYMRYNVYNDEFEFITPKNDTLVLDKIEDFNTILFTGLNKKYTLTKYTDSSNKLEYGYLIAVYKKGNYELLKKENIAFTEEKKAKTTLERDMPAKYLKLDDTYFLRNNDSGISEFPDGKKALIKLFPNHKQVIETFIKDNKISFGEESDLRKIIDFLSTL